MCLQDVIRVIYALVQYPDGTLKSYIAKSARSYPLIKYRLLSTTS